MLTKNKIEKVAENLGFSVNFLTRDYTNSKNVRVVEFSTYSPCGQDFYMDFDYKNLQELPSKIYDYYQSYDPSYEASLWLDNEGHGKNGAPYEMGDLYDDMKWCEASIKELSEALNEAA